MDLKRYQQRKSDYNRQYMPQYHRERRALMISQHRCTNCGARDDYTMSGRRLCKQCCDKGKAYRQGFRLERPPAKTPEELETHLREQHRIYMQERRALFRAHSLCTACGHQDALTLAGKSLCQTCWEKKRGRPYVPKVMEQMESDGVIAEKGLSQAERAVRADQGLCYLCSAPVKTGTTAWGGSPYRLCEHHYSLLRQAGEKGRAAYRELHHGNTWGQDTYDWIGIGKTGQFPGTNAGKAI